MMEMTREMAIGKIHRAVVTGADLHYVGSITVDEDLLDAANIVPGQKVDIVDVNNGERLSTYTIAGERGSGTIQLNGAAAHKVTVGDLVIIMAYAQVPESLVRQVKPSTKTTAPTRSSAPATTRAPSPRTPRVPASWG